MKNFFSFSVIGLLIISFLIVFLWNKIFVTIHAGEAGVLFERFTGTIVDKIYSEGFYYIMPWDIMIPYNVRIQEQNDEFEVLTKQGLHIDIKLSIRFKPEYNMLGIIHKEIGPDYVDSVVVPEVESVVRRYFGQFDDEEIYTSKGAILQKIVNESVEQLAQKFIILDDLIVRKIKFPESVQKAIENKITEFHKFKAYEYKLAKEHQELERKRVEAEGIKIYKDTISKNITDSYLKWAGIQATKELAKSNNAKIIVIGAGDGGLPIILGQQ